MAWRVAKSIVQLQAELDARFPNRIRPDWTIGDENHPPTSDHTPNSSNVVTAIDVRGVAVAQWLWDYLLRTRDPRIKYVIHDREIFSSVVSPWTPRAYNGSNGHIDHIHISVGPEGSRYDDTSSWGIGDANTSPTPAPIRRTTMNVAMPLLRRGDEGGDVESLQVLLNAKASQKLVIDGDFGPLTEGAVERVQAFFKLSVDGVVGGQTWPTLFL